jgi:hypothetical protein
MYRIDDNDGISISEFTLFMDEVGFPKKSEQRTDATIRVPAKTANYPSSI